MIVAGRACVVALGIVLVAQGVPMPRATANDTGMMADAAPAPAPTAAPTAGVPDPVMYVPEAADPDVSRRPEAQIGFASRDPLVARRPRTVPSGSATGSERPTRPIGTAAAVSAASVGATPDPTTPPVTLPPAPTAAATSQPAQATPGPWSVRSGATGTSSVQSAGDPQIKGTIRGPGDAALSGATVCLDDSDGYPICMYFATAAADGTYAVTAPTGSYQVRAWAQSGDLLPGYWSATGFQSQEVNAGIVSVGAGDVTDIDITLPPYPRLSGTVTDAGGRPVAGLSVSTTIYPGNGATTAADGTYSLKVWPGASGIVGTNRTPTYRWAWYATTGTALLEADATVLTVGPGVTAGIDLEVPTWPRISGHVTDVDGNAVAGLPILFSYGYYNTLSTSTDEHGAYLVYANGGGGWTATFGYNSPEWKTSQLSVTADADVTLDAEVHRYPTVTGRLVDRAGDAVPGIAVTIGEPGYPAYFTQSTTTNADGRFTLRYLSQEPTRVSFSDATGTYVPGYFADDGYAYRFEHATIYTLGSDDVLDTSITIPAYVHLTGHLAAFDGTPIASGEVTPRSPLASAPAASLGEDGSFAVKLPPGPWTFGGPGGTFGAEGFAFESAAAVPWQVDEDRDVQLVYPGGHEITGRVTAGGVGLGGIEVDVFVNGSAFTSTTTASDGTYRASVPPGAYLVGFYDAKNAHASGWYRTGGFTSDPDLGTLVSVGMNDATVNISLPAIRHISGKVVDLASSEPVRYAFVEAFVNGSFYSSQYAKSNGTYSLPVAPGAVTLWVYDTDLQQAPGWRTSTGLSANSASASVITVGTADRTGITIRTPKATLLSVDAAWAPIPGSRVGIYARIEAVAYGATASFDIIVNGQRYLPVLKGSYRFWTQIIDNTYGLASGWRRGSAALTPDAALATVTSATGYSMPLTITVPTAVWFSGNVTDAAGSALDDIDVQLYADGGFYEDVLSAGGSFSIYAVPGTYRMAFIDAFGRYRTGWLGGSGFVLDSASARSITLAVGEGVGGLSASIPLQSPPTPPTNVAATPYHASALVSFAAAATTVARPIYQYAVTASPGGRQCIAATGTSCLVTGLVDGTAYAFTVTTSTIVGSSTASTASSPVTPLPVPDAPTGLLATPSGSDVVLSWTVAAANGSAVTSYLATASPGGQSCAPPSADATTCTVHALADGRYTMAVRATNGVGQGPVASVPVVVDTVAPTVGSPTTTLRSGLVMAGSGVPVHVAWTASDGLSGVADTSLQLAAGSGAYTEQALVSPFGTSLDRTVSSSSNAYRFRDRAVDASGNASAWATGPATYVTLRADTGTGIRYAGTWTSAPTTSALGGKLRYTARKGASVSYTFTGRGVTFVTRRGTTSGKVAVYLDGKLVTTLDLYRSSTMYRWVAYTRAATPGKHVLKLVNQATSGRPRLYVDGFASIR